MGQCGVNEPNRGMKAYIHPHVICITSSSLQLEFFKKKKVIWYVDKKKFYQVDLQVWEMAECGSGVGMVQATLRFFLQFSLNLLNLSNSRYLVRLWRLYLFDTVKENWLAVGK